MQTFMSMPADKLNQEALNNDKRGELATPIFTGRATSLTCGAIARISLQVNDDQIIRNATFKVAGCSVLVSALTNLTGQAVAKSTAEAAVLAEDLKSIETRLDNVSSDRVECVLLASEALLEAIRSYSDAGRENWEGDDALICTCFGVSERTIENEVQLKNLLTVQEVTRACNAGAGCRSCYPLIEDILEEVN